MCLLSVDSLVGEEAINTTSTPFNSSHEEEEEKQKVNRIKRIGIEVKMYFGTQTHFLSSTFRCHMTNARHQETRMQR